ncbi:serine protease persephone-like [Planococcus citri]|uniref:serine protease persephone-like n=1 Tax=Planococcus citri TaxID=170843 RepID=UPI0031F9F32B
MQNMSRFWIIFYGVFTLTQDAYSISIKMHYCTQSEQHCVLLSECTNSRSLITSKQAELCGFHDEINENQRICCNSTNIVKTKKSELVTSESTLVHYVPLHKEAQKEDENQRICCNSTNNVKNRNSAAVALQKCQEYSKYRYEQKGKADEPSMTARIIGGTRTQVREYPHMALIGYEKELNRGPVKWNCAGSLISENFVMSAAYCVRESWFTDGPPQWVLLGELDKPATWSPFASSKTIESAKYNEYYRIIKIHEHPNYNTPTRYNDIVLFELNTTVTFSPRVRPACLYTSTTDLPINTKAIITGWGENDTDVLYDSTLLKATIAIVDPEDCSTSFPPKRTFYKAPTFDPKTMICAGDIDNDTKPYYGDGGGPLQISMPERVGMWNIIGVIPCGSFRYGGCGKHENPSIYTKVSHYLDWIQSIVWP